MSFTDEREHVWGLISENVAHFLVGYEHPISESSYDVIAGLLGEEFIADLVMNGYEGTGSTVLIKAKGVFPTLPTADPVYRKRCYAFVVEEIRKILRMENKSAPATLPEVVDIPSRTKLPKTADSRENREYKCSKCSIHPPYVADGISDLYFHLLNTHGEEWASKKLALLGHAEYKTGRVTPPEAPTPYEPRTTRTVRSEWVPKYRLDLSPLLDGRYCVEETPGNFKYVRVVTIKRLYTRRGRYNWGMTTHAWQKIMPGTREVRQQVGDTKKLFGEVRDDIYYGEEEEALKLILQDPIAATVLYGERMKCCGYCGKSLTDPLSQERHIGPDCWEDKHIPALMAQLKRRAEEATRALAEAK